MNVLKSVVKYHPASSHLTRNAVALVLTTGELGTDIAVYAKTTLDDHVMNNASLSQLTDMACQHGIKLTEKEALRQFPEIVRMYVDGFHYRR